MSNEFIREERYIVFKMPDLGNSLKGDEIRKLAREYAEHLERLSKKPLDYVVIESGWSEYGPTWRVIEARVTGAQNVPSVPACADIMDGARYRWLRENGLANEKRESRAVLPRGGKKASMAFRYWTTPEELDMAIDAMLIVEPEAKP